MALALYRTYRPSNFKDVTGQDHIVKTIQNQLASDSVSHAYLFTGPRGVGKTTIARLIAKSVNCESKKENEPCDACEACSQIKDGKALDVFEIDAASQSDVENVRENIIKSVRFTPNTLNKKVYIIDEVHMLSTSAFNALLKTLEEPPAHALFVLATTEIHKVPETIISRCQRFDFKKISKEALVKRMQKITKAEGVNVDDEVLKEIARHSTGCARDAESLLGQILALGEKEIGINEASLVLPATTTVLVEKFIDELRNKNAAGAIRLLNEYLEQGIDLIHFLNDVISWMRNKLLENLSSGSNTAFLRNSIEQFLNARRYIKTDNIPQLPAELAIVEICGFTGSPPSQGGPQGVADTTKSKDSNITPPAPVNFNNQGVDSSRPPENTPVDKIDSTESKTKEPPKVFDSVPVLALDDVKKKWPEVFKQIKECNASLPIMMKDCEVADISGEEIKLGFDYDLYVSTVNKEKNRTIVENVLKSVLGKDVKIRAVLSKGENDDTVNQLLEDFGGSVV